MNTGDLRVYGDLQAGVWQRIYSSGELTASAASVTISSLNGNTDKVWKLVVDVYGSVSSYTGLTFNGDTLAIYGSQQLYGVDAVINAARTTANANMSLLYCYVNQKALNENIIYAKSGTVRTMIKVSDYVQTTTTVGAVYLEGFSYSETSVNITSLVITGGIGSTSTIDLYRRVDAS